MNDLLNHYNRAIKRDGKICTVNNTTTEISCLFKETNDGTKGIDTKIIITSAQLNQGDIINNNGIKYMIVTKNEPINNVYTSYAARECPYSVNFDFSGTIKSFDMYTDKQLFALSSPSNGSVGIIPTNKIYVSVQNTSDTRSINVSNKKRLIKLGTPWIITGIDKTINGIITFTCDSDAINSNDDMENEIAYEEYAYSISVSPNSVTIDNGTTSKLTTIIKNHNMIVDSLPQYSSSNTSISTISSDGTITGVGTGTCNITVTFVGEDNKTYTKVIPITIRAVHNYSLNVSPANISIDTGNTSQISSVVTDNGTNISNPVVSYISSNTSIATVSSAGLVTAVGVGNCTITVSYVGENTQTYTNTVNISVAMAHNYVLSVSPTTINIDTGKTSQITASVTDKGVAVSNPVFNYASSSTSIATVDSNGLVTGVADGTCNVTVSFVGADNQTYTSTISTTINKPASTGIVITATPDSITNKVGNVTVTMKVINNGVDVTTSGGYWFNFSSSDTSVADVNSLSDYVSCAVNVKTTSKKCTITAAAMDANYAAVGTVTIPVN